MRSRNLPRTLLTDEDRAANELRKRRRDYQLASTRGLTLEEAREKIRTILSSANVRGARPFAHNEDLALRVERSFGVAADLYIQIDRDWSKTVNPDNEKQAAGTYDVKVEISWSGTSRSIAAATASIALYRELVDLGAEIAAVMQQTDVRWVWDMSPEELKIPAPVNEVEQMPAVPGTMGTPEKA